MSPPVVEAQQRPNGITHGPILGRLGAHEIGIWARTQRSGVFRVRYGLRPKHLNMMSGPVTTRIERDNTGWAHITNLEADTKYYYELVVGENDMPATLREGSFHTLPDAEQVRDPTYNPKGLFNFSFEFACGNSQSPSGLGPALPTFKTMLDRLPGKIDFAILNGDWLYEDRRDYPPAQWLNDVGLSEDEAPTLVRVAPTIVGVWENYKVYLERGNNLSLWHRVVPSFFTLDDHEILDNVYGSGTAGFRHRRSVFRDIGVQGWYDYLAWSNPPLTEQGIVFGTATLNRARPKPGGQPSRALGRTNGRCQRTWARWGGRRPQRRRLRHRRGAGRPPFADPSGGEPEWYGCLLHRPPVVLPHESEQHGVLPPGHAVTPDCV
jgi:phosphodiesterase/alkaline phosphatase D-like protein